MSHAIATAHRTRTASRVRRYAMAVSSAMLLVAGLAVPSSAATQAYTTVCVGQNPGCAATLAAALAEVRPGGTVRLLPGRFAGGVIITKNVRIVGSGIGRSLIQGGAPVLTVAPSPSLVVSLSGLVITGGVNSGNGYEAQGGGLYIPATPDGGIGATVSLNTVAVSGNVVTATTTSPSPSGAQCPDGDCPFALAVGGGIANSGNLSIRNSVIANNSLGGALSDADGAGIYSSIGSLSLRNSLVIGNRAEPRSIGRFAEGGGLFVDSGTLSIDHTSVLNNRADLVTSWPVDAGQELIDMNANSGGVHIGDGIQATISHALIAGNAVTAVDPAGEPLGFDAAFLAGDSQVTMSDTVISNNSVSTTAATSEDVAPVGTAVELDGPAEITRTTISANSASDTTTSGEASTSSGLAVYDFSGNPRQVTLTDVRIQNNTATATSSGAPAQIVGVGILNNSLLSLVNTTVTGNRGTAHGTTATAQGAGIWNGVLLSGPPVTLSLDHSRVAGNTLTTSAGGIAQGAGIYTTEPITLSGTEVSHNVPDNCFGAPCTP